MNIKSGTIIGTITVLIAVLGAFITSYAVVKVSEYRITRLEDAAKEEVNKHEKIYDNIGSSLDELNKQFYDDSKKSGGRLSRIEAQIASINEKINFRFNLQNIVLTNLKKGIENE